VADGERDRESEVSSSAIRQLIRSVRAHLTLSRFQAIVGITAGFISIGVGLGDWPIEQRHPRIDSKTVSKDAQKRASLICGEPYVFGQHIFKIKGARRHDLAAGVLDLRPT